jgi:hypothetical protein
MPLCSTELCACNSSYLSLITLSLEVRSTLKGQMLTSLATLDFPKLAEQSVFSAIYSKNS